LDFRWMIRVGLAGADAARRLRIREPHHGRPGKRYPVLSTVVCGVPDLEGARRQGGCLAGQGGQRLVHENLNGQGR